MLNKVTKRDMAKAMAEDEAREVGLVQRKRRLNLLEGTKRSGRERASMVVNVSVGTDHLS